MSSMVVVLLVLAVVLLAALAGVYGFGRFAGYDGGSPSYALPKVGAPTALDELAEGLGADEPAASGLLLIDDNLDAFAVRALSARNAGRSLDIMSYVWCDDLTGRLLMKELLAAADRGVRVRLLIDDINMRAADAACFSLDAHPNVSVRLFNPTRARGSGFRRGLELVLRFYSLNRRMHNKAWIADGRAAIVGGRNIGDAYFDAASTNFRDLDLLLFGHAVGETEAIFDDFWNSAFSYSVRALAAHKRKSDLDRLRHALEEGTRSGHADPYLKRVRERISMSDLVRGQKRIVWSPVVRVISDPPSKAAGEDDGAWLTGDLIPPVDASRENLRITSPYFVPGDRGCAWLEKLVGRGVMVSVLTNSLAATDVAAVHGAYAPYRERLLRAGIRLFELQPYERRKHLSVFGSRGASLHTKAFVVDDRTAFVGSFNFDPRSAMLNTEMGVLFEESRLATEMIRHFDRDTAPGSSFEVSLLDGRLHWEGEVHGRLRAYDHDPEASVARRVLAAVVRMLPVQSQL